MTRIENRTNMNAPHINKKITPIPGMRAAPDVLAFPWRMHEIGKFGEKRI